MGKKYSINRRNSIIVLVVIILALTIIYFGYTQKLFIKKNGPIKIGFVGSLASKQSEDSQALEAIKIAVNEINNLGGIDGSKIELTEYSPNSEEEAEFYFGKLASEDKALAVISTFVDSSDAIEKLKVPTILVGPDILSAKRKEPFYWSLVNSYNAGEYLLLVLSKLGTTFNLDNAMIISDASSSIYNQNILEKSLESANIDYLGHHAFYENNLSSIVADIKNRNPNLVLVFTSTDNAVKFFKEAKKQDFNPKVYLRGFEMLTSDLLGNANILPKNLYLLKLPTLSLASYPSIRSNNPAILKSINEFDAVNGKLIRVTGNPMTTISLNAYDSVYIIKDVIERSNIANAENILNEDRQRVISNLWKTRSFKSLRGNIYPDGKTGFLRRTYATIIIVEDGKLKAFGS